MSVSRIDEETIDRILRKVPKENVFNFYTAVDQPLGVSSDSLIDFWENIRLIDIGSVEFHMARGDFENWIDYLGDIELAKRLRLVREEANLTGEALREKLYSVLWSRCNELLGALARSIYEHGEADMLNSGNAPSLESKEFLDQDVYLEDEKVGKVKEIGIDPEDWRVTSIEIELTKDVAESVLGARKGGVRNLLATSALEEGVARWTERGLNIKVPKAQLHAYLKPVD